jgi:hypothetical protein
MANHVHFNLQVEGISEEQFESVISTETVKRKSWDDSEYEYQEFKELHEQPFMSHCKVEYDEDGYLSDSWNWYCNNVGAKWCNVEDFGGCMLTGYSAWSPPTEMAWNLVYHLSKTFNTPVTAKMTYEDEFRNFIGVNEWETEFNYPEHDDEEGDWDVYYDENYLDGEVITDACREYFGEAFDEADFDRWEEVENDAGEKVIPQEVVDDAVWNFFETGEFRIT